MSSSTSCRLLCLHRTNVMALSVLGQVWFRFAPPQLSRSGLQAEEALGMARVWV